VDAALRHGEIVSVGRGLYALATVEDGIRMAHALRGRLCLASAALHHGWEVLRTPEKPQVVIARGRRIGRSLTADVELHRGDVHPDDVWGMATGIDLTLSQCLRRLPFEEALAIADSALRHGLTPSTLTRAAIGRGPGRRQAQRVAREATPLAANPFESALRAIALDVPGLHVRPQRLISTAAGPMRPDLVDDELRLVLEADSFTWHGDRRALRRDCRRYDVLVAEGWTVLRFAWEDVIGDPAFVRDILVRTVAHLRRGAA
jgi:very-short-patch-repair endonuclease